MIKTGSNTDCNSFARCPVGKLIYRQSVKYIFTFIESYMLQIIKYPDKDEARPGTTGHDEVATIQDGISCFFLLNIVVIIGIKQTLTNS